MEKLQEKDRHYPYCAEVVERIELSDKDYERGKNFNEGVAKLHQSLDGIDDLYFQTRGSSLNDALIVVEPLSPIQRTVVRSDNCYEWTVRPETTESLESLIISYFEIKKGSSGTIEMEGHSPGYRFRTGSDSSLPLKEIYIFDPTQHRVAIHIKEGN